MAGDFGSPPPLCHLAPQDRTLILNLRHAVAPILANNVLPHFTDHSVLHSDRVTQLLDEILKPVQSTQSCLNSQELIILYSATYLHDIGLQLQNASETETIRQLDLPLEWSDLQEDTRRDLLRKHHHCISAELVLESRQSTAPRIGLQLFPDYEAPRIASLCESHNLHLEEPADRTRYELLTEDGPNIRMALLSGLLRTADILDESRRRATREKARTLLLPLDSQSHWWRHYYTENVTFDPSERAICIWFDFPPTRASEYSNVVPSLQVPGIRAEFQRHLPVFNKHGIIWSLIYKSGSKPYSDTEAMPDDVMAHMLAQLRAHQIHEEISKRRAALKTFKEARPHISRRLEELRAGRTDMIPADYLIKTRAIADELWNIGSKRSAVFALASVYEENSQHLSIENRLEIGARLLEMVLEDGTLDLARTWIPQIAEEAQENLRVHREAFRCLSLIAEWYTRQDAYDKAVKAITQTMPFSSNADEAAKLMARAKELHFLQGELRQVAGQPASDLTDHA